MKPESSHDAGALRREAEALVQLRAASSPPPSEAELRALYRELEIHEIELERLNQKLHAAKGEAEAAVSHYTDLFEFSPVGYFNLTADGTIRLVNYTGAKLTGIERAALVGRHFQLFLAEADRPAFNAFLQRVFTIPNRHVCVLRLLKRGALARFVHLEALLAADGQRCRLGLLDITERVQAERELQAGVERLRLAAQATGVGIWEWNVITNQIRWDAQMFRLYGVSPTPDGIVPYDVWSGAVLPEDLRPQEATLQDTVRRCGHSRREFRIRRRDDGEVRHLQSVETVRPNAGGQAEWVVGTNLDVTETKRTEHELIGKNVELAAALTKVKLLSGRLPICAGCKKIRDDQGDWKPVEIYVSGHSEANFTHAFCPDCARKYFSPEV